MTLTHSKSKQFISRHFATFRLFILSFFLIFIRASLIFGQDSLYLSPFTALPYSESYIGLVIQAREYAETDLYPMANDSNPGVRQFALMRLSEFEKPDERSIIVLLNALLDTDETVRFQALAGLIKLGEEAAPYLAKELSNVSPVAPFQYNSEALNGGRNLLVTKSDLAYCALSYAQSKDPNPLILAYYKATPEGQLRIIKLLGHSSAELNPTLEKALMGKEQDLAVAAAQVLSRTGAKAEKAIPLFDRLMDNGAPKIQLAAAEALAKLPGQGHQILRSKFQHSNPAVQVAALKAYPFEADSALYFLSQALMSKAHEVRMAALNRLQKPPIKYYRPIESVDSTQIKYEQFAKNISIDARNYLLESLHDPDPDIRTAALIAIGSLGQIDQNFGQSILDTLVPFIDDSELQIQNAAIEQLYDLALSGISAHSNKSIVLIINHIDKKSYSENNARLVRVLKYSSIKPPVAPKLIENIMDICLASEYAQEELIHMLKSEPSWARAGITELMGRYPKAQVMDELAFSTLKLFSQKDTFFTNALEKLLTHKEQSIRISAALTLYENGAVSDAILNTLTEGAGSFNGSAGLNERAAELLADSIPGGLTRILGIINDKKVPQKTRRSLIVFTLRNAIDQDEQALSTVLTLASDFSNPDLQEYSISVLQYLKSRPAQLIPTLKLALTAKNVKIRKSAIYTWEELGLNPDEIIQQVMADTSESVRENGLSLIAYLPEGDPRKITIAQNALKEPSEVISSAVLSVAGKMGETGQQIITTYVQLGKPINYRFLRSLRALLPLNPLLIQSLKNRIPEANEEEKQNIYALIGKVKNDSLINFSALYHQLIETQDRTKRSELARALLLLTPDPWQQAGALPAALMELQVYKLVKEYLGRIMDKLYPPGFTYASGTSTILPRFPWPPPPGYKRTIVPLNLFPAGSTSNFGGIYFALTNALKKCSAGFEHGLFGIPNGYSLIARMERIEPDATPFPEPARWVIEGTPNLGLLDFLGDLFFQKPGYFRVIVFALTNNLTPGEDQQAKIPELNNGAPSIPSNLAALPVTDQQVLALIYTYERKAGGSILPWQNGSASAQQHLEKAGVWFNLK